MNINKSEYKTLKMFMASGGRLTLNQIIAKNKNTSLGMLTVVSLEDKKLLFVANSKDGIKEDSVITITIDGQIAYKEYKEAKAEATKEKLFNLIIPILSLIISALALAKSYESDIDYFINWLSKIIE